MDWIVDFLAAKLPAEMEALKPQMYALSDRAGRAYEGLTWADSRTRGSTYDTAGVALEAYQLESALDSARDPNFTVADFLRSSGTVYVTAGTENQKLTAAIICSFLSHVRQAVYERHGSVAISDSSRAHPPLTMVLDELANIAPWPDLPAVLREGGSQDLIVVGVLQSLAAAKQRWGDAIGSDFLTIFNNILVLPGIRDKETLETLSMLCGEFDRASWGKSYPDTTDIRQVFPTANLTYNRTRRLSPDEISNGHPQSPDIALALIHGVGPMHLYVTPYFRSPPWLHCLVRSIQHIVKNQPELAVLPLPELARDGGGLTSHLARFGLWHDWHVAVPTYLDLRAQIALPSSEHANVLIYIPEPSDDVLWDLLMDEFEHDGPIIFPGDAPILIPGESSRRSAMVVQDGPTDRLFVIDAERLWKEADESQRARVIEKLGTEPGQTLWVHYRLDSQDWLQRLYAALAVHGPTFSESR